MFFFHNNNTTSSISLFVPTFFLRVFDLANVSNYLTASLMELKVSFLSRECACAMNDLSLSAGYQSGGKFVNSLGNLAILYRVYIRFRYATIRVYSCVVRDKEDYVSISFSDS